MIQLYSMLWITAAFFGVIGIIRGLRKELISLAGIILALFALFQFDALLRGIFLASVPRDQTFFVQVVIFGVIVYLAYQTRMFTRPTDEKGPRDSRVQDAILGGLLGALNGYLIWGAVWYFLDINDYPFAGIITAPGPTSISAQNINAIPLVLLGGAAGGSPEVLTIVVIILFVAVLFMI